MVKVCCVKTCRSESFAGCGISFHRFPRDKEMCKKWLEVVPGRINAAAVVCALHFKPEDFDTSRYSFKKYLKPEAIPSIFTVGKPVKRKLGTRRNKVNVAKIVDDIDKIVADCIVKDNENFDTDYDSNNLLSDDGYDDNTNLKSADESFTQKSEMTDDMFRCKCCLGSGKMKSMWQANSDAELRDYGTALIECFALPWRKPDDPKNNMEKICDSCIKRLRDAVKFKMDVLASEQLLRSQLESEDIFKTNEEYDDEDTEFDVTTEYLNYEYLEDNFDGECDDGDGDQNDYDNFEFGDGVVDKDDYSPECSEDPQCKTNRTTGLRRKRMKSTDEFEHIAVEGVGSRLSKGTKRHKSAETDLTNVDDEPLKNPTKERVRRKKIEGYLEDVLRYSNATPIGHVTADYYQCCFCRERYDSPSTLKHHTLDKHAESVKVKSDVDYIKLDITDLKCLDCYSSVESLHDFVNHLQSEHRMRMRRTPHYPIVPFKFESDVMKCALCGKEYGSFAALNRHMDRHFKSYDGFHVSYREELSGDSDSVGYECSVKSFEELKVVPEKYRAERKDEGSLKCASCGWDFENKTALLIHMKMYHLRLPFKCEHCDSKFLGQKDLARHVTIKHSGKTP